MATSPLPRHRPDVNLKATWSDRVKPKLDYKTPIMITKEKSKIVILVQKFPEALGTAAKIIGGLSEKNQTTYLHTVNIAQFLKAIF